MIARWLLVAGAVLAAVGVILGAYGAHGLIPKLELLGYQASLAKRTAWFETAIRYQMFHAMGLLILGVWARSEHNLWLGRAGFAFLLGIILFCGCLVIMTFANTQWSKLGAIVPIGGLAFVLGWVATGIAAWKS